MIQGAHFLRSLPGISSGSLARFNPAELFLYFTSKFLLSVISQVNTKLKPGFKACTKIVHYLSEVKSESSFHDSASEQPTLPKPVKYDRE